MPVLFTLLGIAVLAGAFLFLVWPAVRRHPDRENVLDGRLIAHRGLHDLREGEPENSLPAFKRAAEEGLAIENDIHLTKDGRVVVFHDDTLDRMCGVAGKPEEKTLSELKELTLAGTGERIPTLEECLEVVNGRVPLLVEFKVSGGNEAALCEAAEKIFAGYAGKYMIQSFYPKIVAWYRKNRPEIMRGQLATVVKGSKFPVCLLPTLVGNVVARPDFVSFDHTHERYFSRRLTKLLGAFPVGWTFRSPDEIRAHRKHFRTFIFGNMEPAEALEALKTGQPGCQPGDVNDGKK
jgi:hypothetical protein